MELFQLENEILFNEYKFSLHTFSPSEYRETGNEITELDVINAHFVLTDYFLSIGEKVRFGVLNFNMLSSAVSRQFTSFNGENKWKDDFHKISTLLYGLTMDHAFHDGNKRTALLCSLLYLNRCKRVVEVNEKMLEELVVRIASGELNLYPDYKRYINRDDSEIEFIADKLRNWTRKRDTRLYTITFLECNSKLKKFGLELDCASGNTINVYKRSNRFLSFFYTDKRKKICQVGFPGWKKQISDKDLKWILSCAGLTPENGVDSEVFFNDAQPTYELLEKYRHPLARLKDK